MSSAKERKHALEQQLRMLEVERQNIIDDKKKAEESDISDLIGFIGLIVFIIIVIGVAKS